MQRKGRGRGRGSDCQAVNSQLSKNGNRKLPELPAAYRFPYDVCVCLSEFVCAATKPVERTQNREKPGRTEWEVGRRKRRGRLRRGG